MLSGKKIKQVSGEYVTAEADAVAVIVVVLGAVHSRRVRVALGRLKKANAMPVQFLIKLHNASLVMQCDVFITFIFGGELCEL